ncbi:hypothetical protein ALI144C_04330 [Actinosynnema sp. ALI-1.44]|uniref:MFS transporter n=1 Tax=Actinosynnema sp. ALI-1.44 TaxID=1933779 RepID=UPI00097BEBF3|nr:MFS transporter [Actinosynnema sp. ALI-1.44]ONI89580.1 hypothetical protein ALI144C_04330 [Actinosynnema sp. ALI-1.44]
MTATSASDVGFRFRCVAGGYALSAAGNYLNLVALSLYTYEVTGGGLGVGLVMALRLAAGSLGGLVAGRLVGRFDRRRLMIGADLVQAAAMTVLVLSARHVVVLAGVVVLLGAGNSLFTVALRTSVPEMVGQSARVKANGLLVIAKSFATVTGFGGAGVVIGFGGVEAAFAMNAATFLVSALAITIVRLRTEDSAPQRTSARVTLGALPFLLLAMVVVRGIDALASSSHNVALSVLAGTTQDGAAFLSRFWVAWAVGILLAHHVVKRYWKPASGERMFALGTGVMSISFALAFTSPPTPVWLCLVAMAGFADGVTEIAYTSRLQEEPERRRGGLFGLSSAAETAGFAVGMVAAGASLEILPAVVVVAMFHGVALTAAAVLLLLKHWGTRHDMAIGTRSDPD